MVREGRREGGKVGTWVMSPCDNVRMASDDSFSLALKFVIGPAPLPLCCPCAALPPRRTGGPSECSCGAPGG